MSKILKKIYSLDARYFVAAEYAIAIYVALVVSAKFLNIIGIMNLTTGPMKTTCYGPGLMVLLLIEYCMLSINCQHTILVKIRPYIIGTIVGGIIGTCNFALCLLLMVIVGYIVNTGFGKKYTVRNMLLAMVTTCAVLEIYSVGLLYQEVEMYTFIGKCMVSSGLDVIFAMVLIGYIMVISKADHECEMFKWVSIVRRIGSMSAWGAILLFVLCASVSVIGVIQLRESEKQIFAIQNCEDTSLVLTVTEKMEKNAEISYSVEFQKNIGANNQKVRFDLLGDGAYRLVFLEPSCALTADMAHDLTHISVVAKPVYDDPEQKWILSKYDNRGLYMLKSLYTSALSYPKISISDGNPMLSVGGGKGIYQTVCLEKTLENELITKILTMHTADFMPTTLLETIISGLSAFSAVFFVLLVFCIGIIIYSRRIIGDRLAFIYSVMLVYLILYGAITVIMLCLTGYALQLWWSYKKMYICKVVIGE